MVLEAHVEGSSLRGISRTVNLADDTVVTLVRALSEKGKLIHNAHLQNINTSQMSSDEFWWFIQKNKNIASIKNWQKEILGLASPYPLSNGLILSARVNKHTDQFVEELLINTEGKRRENYL